MSPVKTKPGRGVQSTRFTARNYDLSATLDSGQAFRWTKVESRWEGVMHGRWVRLHYEDGEIIAETAGDPGDWRWLREYLQVGVDLDAVAATFPTDPAMQAAWRNCRGLRLLRQEPWECLASFILSSSKQIVQIRQIVSTLCERWGERVETGDPAKLLHAFPTAERLSNLREEDLRSCKMGFRAPYLWRTAQMVAGGEIDLMALQDLDCSKARDELLRLPGVGPKIADCVLLFAYGYQEAFPVDVWIRKALTQMYFPRRAVKASQLENFIVRHFGVNRGYAQQYLFHHIRLTQGRVKNA